MSYYAFCEGEIYIYKSCDGYHNLYSDFQELNKNKILDKIEEMGNEIFYYFSKKKETDEIIQFDLSHNDCYYEEDVLLFLRKISPIVKSGSYINYYGEDYEFWQFIFKTDGFFITKCGEVYYEGDVCHTTSCAFEHDEMCHKHKVDGIVPRKESGGICDGYCCNPTKK